MKRKLTILLASLFLVHAFTGVTLAQTEMPSDFGAKGALQDTSIALEEALVYAIQDEYLGKARYSAILNKFGSIRPFSNIVVAEQRHIAALLPLFKKYNVNVPEENANQYVSATATLKEAFQQGVKGEVDNIAMYDKLKAIPSLPEDVKTVFTQLGDASKNHLQAFRRGLGRGE